MGHRDLQTTLIYADYAASPHETAMVDNAFIDEHEYGPDTAPETDRP